MRSDVANDPNKVELAVMSWAVAKKLTDPPTKEADKQAHATRASVRDNPKDGNLENNTKDVKHPTKDPIEEMKNGKATVRIDLATGSCCCLVFVVTVEEDEEEPDIGNVS
jgi:hypothetical protein